MLNLNKKFLKNVYFSPDSIKSLALVTYWTLLSALCPYSHAAKSLQSCPTLCGPMDWSPLGSSVHGILQARIPEWVTFSFSNIVMLLLLLSRFSCVWLFVTPWPVALQAPLSMGFSRQEYRSGLPCPPPGDLPDPGNLCILHLLHWRADSLPLKPPGKPLFLVLLIVTSFFDWN